MITTIQPFPIYCPRMYSGLPNAICTKIALSRTSPTTELLTEANHHAAPAKAGVDGHIHEL